MRRIREQDLRRLEPADLEARLAELMKAVEEPVDGELETISAEIETLEKKTGLRAAAVRDELSEGRIAETDDVCRLLMLLALRDRLEQIASRPG